MGIWCREDLNVVIAMKAMGVESEQEIVGLIGPEPAFTPLLAPTLQECKHLGIHTQQQALEFIGAGPRRQSSLCFRAVPGGQNYACCACRQQGQDGQGLGPQQATKDKGG